jgi:hypothetical protein
MVKRQIKLGVGNTPKSTTRLPHTSFYCTPAVLKALKEIAVENNCKVHDLLVEGVRGVLAQHGRDYDLLSKRQ